MTQKSFVVYQCDYCGKMSDHMTDALPEGWIKLGTKDYGITFEFENPLFKSVRTTPKETHTRTLWLLDTPKFKELNKHNIHVCSIDHAVGLVITGIREMNVQYNELHKLSQVQESKG